MKPNNMSIKKLSVSTIKYLLDDEYKFVNKFTVWIDVDPVNVNFAIWSCLHKIAEHYSNTWEFSKDVWFILLSDIIDSNKIIDSEWNEIDYFTDDELEEIILNIDSASENLKETLIAWWHSEVKIETDDFVWYIDLLKDWWIMDYKFVKNFNSKWMFDSIPSYLIQMSLYSILYIKQFWTRPQWCAIIEVKKWDTLIWDPQYIKKDYILDLIRKQNPYEEINEKLTKEKLIEIYKPRDKWFQWIKFDVDDDFINFGESVLSMAVDIRNLVVNYSKSDSDDEKSVINKTVKILVKKFKQTVSRFVDKYYNSHLIN